MPGRLSPRTSPSEYSESAGWRSSGRKNSTFLPKKRVFSFLFLFLNI